MSFQKDDQPNKKTKKSKKVKTKIENVGRPAGLFVY